MPVRACSGCLRPVLVGHAHPITPRFLACPAAAKSKTFVLFTGAVDPATGKSWCPDCVDAYPTIHASIDKAEPPVTLITVPLVRAEYRGNASHWAR